jgi:hypothetical protein
MLFALAKSGGNSFTKQPGMIFALARAVPNPIVLHKYLTEHHRPRGNSFTNNISFFYLHQLYSYVGGNGSPL